MIELNIIYTDQTAPSHIVYENDIGKVLMSKGRNDNIANIAMNSYSAINMKENDSIFIIEPICVSEQNYNIKFLKQFKYIFTWATKAFEGTEVESKVTYVNLPSYKGCPQIDKSKWLPWEKRSDEVVFIANNKSSHHKSELYSLRTKLADWLHQNSKLKVSWYGNMPIKRPYYKGKLNNKQDVLTTVKFHVCIENAYDQVYSYNYLSEKMPDAWFSGVIPIYMGCSNLDELGINKNCYLDLNKFGFAQINEKMENFSVDDYKNMTSNYYELNNKLYSLTSYENVFNIMLRVYSGNNNI